jgi:hypothetical protein
MKVALIILEAWLKQRRLYQPGRLDLIGKKWLRDVTWKRKRVKVDHDP